MVTTPIKSARLMDESFTFCIALGEHPVFNTCYPLFSHSIFKSIDYVLIYNFR